MAGISLSGLSSGFDWKSVVQQLTAAQRQNETPIITQQNTLTTKQADLGTVKALLDSLKSASDDLKTTRSDYYQRKTAQANDVGNSTSNLSSTADGTTPLGDYIFNVTRKATATQVTGAQVGTTLTDTSKTLTNLNIATTITYSETDPTDSTIKYGSFTINGKKIQVRPTDTLQSVLNSIGTATSGAVTATLSNNKIVLTSNSAITLGSSNDTTNFLEALKLYTTNATTDAGVTTISSAVGLGALNTQISLTNSIDTGTLTGLTNGSGTFSINGVSFTYNTSSDSIRSIINQINSSSAGVLFNYDTGSGKITITNQQTGSTGVSISDTTGLFEKLGLTAGAGATTSYGLSAQFTVNGSATVLTSNSNTVDESITGIPGLKVTFKDTGTDTITVTADTSAFRSKLSSFISAYNAVNDKIGALSKITVNKNNNTVTAGSLAKNLEVTSWQTDLRSYLYQPVSTGVSTVSRLYQIGVETSSTSGTLSITNQSALDKALSENPNAVAAIFNTSSAGGGIGNVISDYITNVTKTNGVYQSQTDSITNQLKTLQDQLERMERKIKADETALTNSFLNMEQAQAKIQQQSKIISSVLGG